MATIEEKLMAAMRELVPEGVQLALPPPIFHELEMEFLDYREGELLECRFPAQEKFTNPMGVVQGGILGAAFDTCYGSLAFLATRKPCVSLSMDTFFIRPITLADPHFTVKVWIRETTRTMVFLEGEASNAQGKLASTSSTIMTFYKPSA